MTDQHDEMSNGGKEDEGKDPRDGLDFTLDELAERREKQQRQERETRNRTRNRDQAENSESAGSRPRKRKSRTSGGRRPLEHAISNRSSANDHVAKLGKERPQPSRVRQALSNFTPEAPVSHRKATEPVFWIIVGLHLLVVLLNVVPLYHYFARSWQLEHYKFFPFAFAIFAYIVYLRIDWGTIRYSRWTPFACSFFLLIGVASFAVSTIENNHYLPAVGTIFVLGSLLTCLSDKETEKSLFPVWFLLLPLIRIPLNFDVTLISELQFFSASFAGNVLDFVGIPNYTPGTVIQVIQQGTESGVKKFDVERACSGVQSLYTLFFCTLTVAVWSRRSFLAGIILVASGVFWSITMNGMRIVTCVAAFYWFDVDIYSGIAHEILGYVILLAAIGLIASTDALIHFLVSPVQVPSESRNVLAYLWNRLVAGVNRLGTAGRQQELSESARRIIMTTVIIGALVVNLSAGWLFADSVGKSQFERIPKVGQLGFDQNNIPTQIQGKPLGVSQDGEPIFQSWSLVENSLANQVRNTNSTYGPYSTSWVYRAQPVNDIIQVSFDYTFLGWHELKVCYKGQGWKVRRAVIPDEQWQPVELYLSRDNGETGYCIFSIFDFQGKPLDPLSDNLGFFWLRLKNRINRELSTTTTFQIQCFIEGYDEIPKDRIDSVKALHLQLREKMRALTLESIRQDEQDEQERRLQQ